MRFSASLLVTPLPILSSAVIRLSAAPTDSDFEWYLAASVSKWNFENLEARGILPQLSTATAFTKYLQTSLPKLTQPPVFWTGRHGRKGAKAAAGVLKKDAKIAGANGESTSDAVLDSKINTTGWKPGAEWLS
ncbi:hypothetical protein DXG01_002610 [Tephrocybe rancida]|nr:hypothetical protein DXG01_002610 [Tephrocybe rancida]